MSRGRALRWAVGAVVLLAAAPAAAAPARVVYSTEFGLRTINADGSDMRSLTIPGEAGPDEQPTWSPDGRSIAFVRYQLTEDHDDLTQVWQVGADGGHARPLTPASESSTEGSPAFSPDGRELAVVRTRLGRRRAVVSIVAIDLASGSRRTIHSEASDLARDPAAFFESLAWSPRGDAILFTRTTFGGKDDLRPTILSVPAAGGAPSVIVRQARQGAWSPDASRIAYADVHDESGEHCDEECSIAAEIYVADADGAEPRRLTTSRDADDAEPSWSGDGRRIVFHSARNFPATHADGPRPELYSVEPDGSCLTWLTNGTARSESPDFVRDPSLSSDPGGCDPTTRPPLVEAVTDLAGLDRKRPFSVYWLGEVAPNGLLLTNVVGGARRVELTYGDCGRFDPTECGEPLILTNDDLCYGGGILNGVRPGTMSLFRGSLLTTQRDGDLGWRQLYAHRTRVEGITEDGEPARTSIFDALRPVGGEREPGSRFPSTRLPVRTWRALRERPGIRRRLAQLGVKRRLGC